MYAVFSDVAGQFDALMRLVQKVPKGYEIIFLGDLPDRGPDSDLVIDWVIESGKRCVLANHEHMLYDYYSSHRAHGVYGAINGGLYDRAIWLQNGGWATYTRYKDGEGRSAHLLNKHLDWINTLPTYLKLPLGTDFPEVLLSHAPLHQRYGDDDLSFATESLLWSRSAPIRRRYFQVNGHNSHWGLMPYQDQDGVFGYCLDDSRKDKLTCMLLPEMTILQEDYLRECNP